jgi:hypothetical protein
LNDNKLNAMHPWMFAHLTNLNILALRSNPCINRSFNPVTSLVVIEQELSACAANYPASITDMLTVQNVQAQHEEQLKLLAGQVEANKREIEQLRQKIEMLPTKLKN